MLLQWWADRLMVEVVTLLEYTVQSHFHLGLCALRGFCRRLI